MYLILILLVVQVVSMRVAFVNKTSAPSWWWRFGLTVIPLSALFNALSVHFGDTVLLTIPGNIPLISGPVSLEALVYGSLNGLLITVVMSVFGVFNIAVPAYHVLNAIRYRLREKGFHMKWAAVREIMATHVIATMKNHAQQETKAAGPRGRRSIWSQRPTVNWHLLICPK